MNRLEIIKERLQQDFYVKSHPTWGKDDIASKDVEWLTQRLERYEKALKNIVDEADLHNSEVWERMKEMERIAEEALKE